MILLILMKHMQTALNLEQKKVTSFANEVKSVGLYGVQINLYIIDY